MKNIKCFKYWYSYEFERCLKGHGYTLDDVKGYSVSDVRRYHGNVLKIYIIYVHGGESVYFSVVYFKSFNEYNQSRLGFNGNKLLMWCQISKIKHYKLSGEYIIEY